MSDLNVTRVIFLHGAPAVGKLTVAKAIAAQTPTALLDNHIVIDFAKSVLPFGAPGFFDLVRDSRVLALRYAVRQKVPLVVITSCYSDPEDRPQLEEIEKELPDPVAQLLPVFLFCSKEAQCARVGNVDRADRGKLVEAASLEQFEKQWQFVPVPRAHCYQLDTTEWRPEASARMILEHFQLT